MDKNGLVCRCFYTDNYFVRFSSGDQHIRFFGREDFIQNVLPKFAGRIASDEIDSILAELETEYKRRCSLGELSLHRRAVIQEKYRPLNPHVYNLQEEYLSPEFIDVVKQCSEGNLAPCVLPKHLETIHGADSIFKLPIFTAGFCKDFREEILNFSKSDLPKGRPNTMNKYGILLEDLGLNDGLLDPLREKYLAPIYSHLFPELTKGGLDSHKAFVVSYRMGEDVDLAFHFDNAEVTCNISLNDDFDEGVLYFGNMKAEDSTIGTQAPFAISSHKLGHGLLHRGQHMHGAMPITDGERHNLIIWMRSSTIRNKLCPMCRQKPRLVQVEGPGDGFTAEVVNVCNVA